MAIESSYTLIVNGIGNVIFDSILKRGSPRTQPIMCWD